MPRTSISGLAAALLPAVLAAGTVQLGHRADGVRATYKSDGSPVTLADQRSEEIILDALHRVMPGVGIIAEEQASDGTTAAISDVFFLVDPLDGTKEYVSGQDDFTVNIALIESGAPIFGMVYAPARALLYATLEFDAAIAATIAADSGLKSLDGAQTRVIRTRPQPKTGAVAVASRSHGREATLAFLSRLQVTNESRIGSSLKFGLIARGEADLYPRFGEINEWDTAAGHAVLAAAGGCVTVADGSKLTYGKSDRNFLNPFFVAWGDPNQVVTF
jgi:3'(2'), 5'-bisphosphate nucleotidase